MLSIAPRRELALGAATAAVLVLSLAVVGSTGPKSGYASRTAHPAIAAATPTEAPARFDNQTNGFEPPAKFDEDRAKFDETEDILDTKSGDCKRGGGLGPVYNSTSCVACHQNSGQSRTPEQAARGAVSGSHSQVSEVRAGHNVRIGGKLFFKEAPGGSVIQQRATDPRVQEHVPPGETITTLRMATSILGDGFVECIPDNTIRRIRAGQPSRVRGTIVSVPVVVRPTHMRRSRRSGRADVADDFEFVCRIGRFGWKCQEASLQNFSAGAYVNEMGVTSPLQQKENTSLGRDVPEFDQFPPDNPDEVDDKPTPDEPFGEDVEAFTRFMRSTKTPPTAVAANRAEKHRWEEGERIFTRIGCADCHINRERANYGKFVWVTQKNPNAIVGDAPVGTARANKIIHPFSDFMLHDIGTGDGIVQTQFAPEPPQGLALPPARELRAALQKNGSQRVQAVKSARIAKLNTLLQCQNPSRGQAPIQVVRYDEDGMVFNRFTANMMRTAPLWGLRTRVQLLHDGRALTIEKAIALHRGQANSSRIAFNGRSSGDRMLVLEFLKSL